MADLKTKLKCVLFPTYLERSITRVKMRAIPSEMKVNWLGVAVWANATEDINIDQATLTPKLIWWRFIFENLGF